MNRRILHLAGCFAVLMAAAGAQQPGTTENKAECRGSEANLAWAQQALDAWRTASRDVLALDAAPLPRIVLFDATCVWHLGGAQHREAPGASSPLRFGGEPVAVSAAPHDGVIRLPNGKEVPARPIAFASVYDDGRSPFFVLALLELWRADHPKLDPDMAARFFLGVAVHELVHTVHIVAMGRRVESLQAMHELPENIVDATVEERFREVPAFAEALEAERQALLNAAAAADPERRRNLAAEALSALRQRRDRYLTGADAPYAEIEDLFLALEGLAVWTHAEVARLDPDVLVFPDQPDGLSEKEVLEVMRERGGEWVQHAGYALVVLLEKEARPRWRQRLLAFESPVALLEEALAEAVATGDPG